MQKEFRLKKKKDFKKVYIKGKSFSNRELVLYVFNNFKVNDYRLGISVSKKIGNAVVRNKIRRLIKEVVRKKATNIKIKKNIDIVIIARKPASEMNYTDFERSILDLYKKAKIIIK